MKSISALIAVMFLSPAALADLTVESAQIYKPGAPTTMPAPKITKAMCNVKGSNPERKVECLVIESNGKTLCRAIKPGFAPQPELVCP